MAKKQSVASTESTPAKGVRSKEPQEPGSRAPESSRKEPAPKSPVGAASRVLAQEEIGAVAGEVWHALAQSGPQSVPQLKKAVSAPGDLILAAIGWLAREGKLEFSTTARTPKISLR